MRLWHTASYLLGVVRGDFDAGRSISNGGGDCDERVNAANASAPLAVEASSKTASPPAMSAVPASLASLVSLLLSASESSTTASLAQLVPLAA